MLKWLFGLLLAANLIFFAVMKWGGWLTTELENPTVKAELNADKILLLNQSSATNVTLPVTPVVPAKSDTPAETNKLVCYHWGDFLAAEIAHAQQSLVKAQLPNKIHQYEVVRPNGYWVYIGPLNSSEMVKLNSLQLKTLGISDFYVLSETGPWQNTISLGVYKTEVAANSYLTRLTAKNVKNAQVGLRERKENQATFMVGPLVPSALDKLSALRQSFPNNQLQEVSCSAK